VTWVIPWIRAFPERVALLMLSTEVGDVKTCLYAWIWTCLRNSLRVRSCEEAHGDKDGAAEKAFPWVLLVKSLPSVQKERPLISGN
jgi:hypothetical protein